MTRSDDPEFETPFEEGRALFNEGRFFECHEVWEHLWMETGDDRAHLLKGLLQAAIAIHHFRRSNFEGARKLFEGQKRILAPFRPESQQLALAEFDQAMDLLFEPLLRARPGERPEFRAERVPKLLRGGP
ncbi:MAG: DUF309 domain-containing protein [Planctomycetes bacterium]|nr:DUF309 domain-containing protein [Planctomycetota bacterium]